MQFLKPVVSDTACDTEVNRSCHSEMNCGCDTKKPCWKSLEFFCALVITGAYVEERAQNKKVDLVHIL